MQYMRAKLSLYILKFANSWFVPQASSANDSWDFFCWYFSLIRFFPKYIPSFLLSPLSHFLSLYFRTSDSRSLVTWGLYKCFLFNFYSGKTYRGVGGTNVCDGSIFFARKTLPTWSKSNCVTPITSACASGR